MTNPPRPPTVHLYGWLARTGHPVTACGQLLLQLPRVDTMVMPRALDEVTCLKCTQELKP